jgi:hypothetical protein
MWRPGYVEDAGEVDAGVAGVDDDELESLDEEPPESDELEEPESLDGVVDVDVLDDFEPDPPLRLSVL